MWSLWCVPSAFGPPIGPSHRFCSSPVHRLRLAPRFNVSPVKKARVPPTYLENGSPEYILTIREETSPDPHPPPAPIPTLNIVPPHLVHTMTYVMPSGKLPPFGGVEGGKKNSFGAQIACAVFVPSLRSCVLSARIPRRCEYSKSMRGRTLQMGQAQTRFFAFGSMAFVNGADASRRAFTNPTKKTPQLPS